MYSSSEDDDEDGDVTVDVQSEPSEHAIDDSPKQPVHKIRKIYTSSEDDDEDYDVAYDNSKPCQRPIVQATNSSDQPIVRSSGEKSDEDISNNIEPEQSGLDESINRVFRDCPVLRVKLVRMKPSTIQKLLHSNANSICSSFVQKPAQKPARKPIKKSTPKTINESAQKSVKKSAPKTIKKSTPKTIKKSTPKTIKKSTPAAIKKLAQKSIKKSAQQSVEQDGERNDNHPYVRSKMKPLNLGKLVKRFEKAKITDSTDNNECFVGFLGGRAK